MANTTKRMLSMSLKKLLSKTTLDNITIQDITNDAEVSRKTFYYHFQDIPDLICYMMEQGSKELLENCLAQPTLEDKIRYLLSVALNADRKSVV